jgi:hypothetical protein
MPLLYTTNSPRTAAILNANLNICLLISVMFTESAFCPKYQLLLHFQGIEGARMQLHRFDAACVR